MSIRVYHGPHASDRRRLGSWRVLPVVLAVATIVAQVLWVLADDRFWITHIVVGLFTLTTLTHAVIHRGWAWSGAYAALTLLFGFGIELLGTTTGLPFGPYEYAATIGERAVPAVLGVPLVVPLAWSMMAYPALMVAWRLVGRRGNAAVALVGAVALSAWDLFLDPQMVAEGWWTWSDPRFALPGIPGIPLQNYLGWLLSTAVLMVALSWLPFRRGDMTVPILMYLWMWIGGIVMNIGWLGRPGVAAWGGTAMGIVSLLVIRRIFVTRRA